MLTGLLSACVTARPESKLLTKVGQSHLSVDELRIRVRTLSGRFSGEMEALADDLAQKGGDLRTRMAMTRFKINGIPAVQAALFEPDPVAALLDAWVLLAQVENAVNQTDVVADPDLRPIATRRIGDMERELANLWSALAGPEAVKDASAKIHTWAAAHPLTTSLAARESTAGLLAHLTATTGISLRHAVATAVEETQDLQAWMNLQVAFLPKQARWQVEYMIQNAAQDPLLQRTISDLGGFVDRQARAAFGGLDSERRRTQSFLSGEREVVLGRLASERAVVMDDAKQIAIATVDHGFDRAASLTDRIFRRVLLLLALVLAAGLVALQMVLSARKRRAFSGREHA
jgi:hypothetical protein